MVASPPLPSTIAASRATRPPRRRWGWLVLAAVLAAAGGVAMWGLMIRMPGKSHAGPLPPLTADEAALRDELRGYVEHLALKIGPRHLGDYPSLKAAEAYVAGALAEAGHTVERQEYEHRGLKSANLIVELPGSSRAAEIVVVGAHYDTVPGSPGANDNGSGTAALVALAGRWRGARPARTLRLVAFANEEWPYFQTGAMGSAVYADRCRRRGEQIVAAVSLETIGYYTDRPGSQQYPRLVAAFYPSTGNFIGVVGNVASRPLVERIVESFRRQTQFPCEGAALPASMQGVGWSDQWSFWQEGYPGVMLTDTAPFRYPHYHAADDTPDKLDFDRMARVVAGFDRVLKELVAEPPTAPVAE